MTSSHLARFQLERLAADHVQTPVEPSLRVHLRGCDFCRTRLRALTAAKTRFLDTHPAVIFRRDVLTQVARLGPERKLSWWLTPQCARTIIGALALAAAIGTWFAHDAAATWSRAHRDAAPDAEHHVDQRLVSQARDWHGTER